MEHREWDGTEAEKKEMLRQNAPGSILENELPDLLEAGKRTIEDWSAHPGDLAFATRLARRSNA